jgi:3-methyl-2-oxobutanoate hydroxymethyltransferase
MSAQGAARPLTLGDLATKKDAREPIVMVTAYDHPSAQIAEQAGVDMVLVGDSAAMTVLGYPSTVPVTIDEMLMLTKAVRRGLSRALLVGDLPFGSYEASDSLAVQTAQRFVKEAGCDLVKIERGGTTVERARAIAAAGIPVVGHVGLTPQSVTALGGYRAQGRTAEAALAVIDDALALQEAGCALIVVEAVPSQVTALLVERLRIPVIGIGAGADADGQVLVWHDLLGIYDGPAAKFVRRYADVRAASLAGVAEYAREVRSGAYPAPEHGYGIPADEVVKLKELLAGR